jgi:hypothetical protein
MNGPVTLLPAHSVLWCILPRMKQAFGYFFLVISLLSCNATRIIKPLDKGERQIGINAGGPMIRLGSAILPVPLSSVYGAYGISGKTTAFASCHITALLFGVMQTDLGITHRLLGQKRFAPGISISPVVNMMFDTWESNFRFYPQIDLNVFWNYGKKRNLAYITCNNWFELRSRKAHHEVQETHWLPSLGAGHQWSPGKYRWQVELKYIAPGESNQNIVVDYVSPGSNGALGIYFAVARKF